MKKYIILSCLAFTSVCVQSQSNFTLRQCIVYAIENNIDIKKQSLNVDKSEVDLSTNKNSRLPDLNASVSGKFNFAKSPIIETDKYRSSNSSTLGASLSSSTPLFTGFRIPNQIKMDELNVMAATEGLKKAKENLELQVTSLYLEVLFKKEILKIYQEQAELTRQQIGRTEALVESGKVPQAQLYDIKAQLAKDELNITSATNDLDMSLLNLSQSLNLTQKDDFDIEVPVLGDVITENIGSIQPVNSIYETAIRIKPHVKEVEYTVESSKKALNIAKSGYYPTVTFDLGYNTSASRIYNSKSMEFRDQLKNFGSQYIGVSVNVPIFNRLETRNRVRTARLNIEGNTLSLSSVKLDLYKEIQQAHQSAIAAQSKYTSTEKAYTAAAEAHKYAQYRYEVGKSTAYELNEAQTKLLTSKSEQIQAKYDFLFRTKILDFYRGERIDIK